LEENNHIINIAKVARDLKDLNMTLAVIRTLDAEKRTHLAGLRTGIGILTIPFSLLTILIATSNYYSIHEVIVYVLVLVFGIIFLSIIGAYLVLKNLTRIRSTDRLRKQVCIDTDSIFDTTLSEEVE
jgi:uncharacterized membrane protein YidH (DUF202 family)